MLEERSYAFGAVAWVLLLGSLAACGPSPGESAARGGSVVDSSQPPQGEAESASPTPRVDNVLLITIDTLRWDALGFAGEAQSVTPFLDRFAAAGRVYLDAHAHNVVTLPSHVNILTGLYPFQHGVRDNAGFVLPRSIPTAATLLHAAGFATAAIIGAFPLDARFGLDRGFDLYDDEVPEGSRPTEIVPAERRGDEVVRRALAWWRSHEHQRRFLWVHLFDPHAPYEPPEPFASRHADDPYLGEVAATDAYLQPLVEPFLDNREAPTLILFTADHGEALGDHGELTHGLFAYEATLKVPLVIWHPEISAARIDEPARHIDLLPTLLEAADVAVPGDLPGRSLLGGSAASEVASSYFEALTATLDRGWAPLRGLLEGGEKFIALPLAELYDLKADPAEAVNLLPRRQRRARQLAARLPAESAWPPERGEVDSETEAALRSLGYLGGSVSRRRYTEDDDPKNLVSLDREMHRVVDLYQRHRLDEAEAVVRGVIDARPDMGIAYYYWAQVLLEKSEVGEAIEVMKRARARDVATPSLTRQLGLSLAEVGRLEEAVGLLRPLAAEGDPDSLNALGLVLSESGSQDESKQVLERVFERDPRNATALQHLALVALRSGQWSEARSKAEAALRLNEELPLAWNYLGTALYNLSRPREALQAWERALAIEADNADVLYNVSLVALEVGDRERAREALQAFIDSAPPARYASDIERAKSLLRQLDG